MKKIFTKLLAFSSIGLLMLASCNKDESNKAVSVVGKAGTLTASSTTPVLTRETAADVAVTFSWPATSVTGYVAPVSYTLQMDTKGSSFKSTKLVEVALTGKTQSYTVGSLNAILLTMGLSFDNKTDLDVRVKSMVAANSISYTNTLTLSVQPYKLSSSVYVAGLYQSSDASKQWSPSTADSLVSPNSDGIYDGLIGFPDGRLEFKITSAKDWNHTNYGDGGAGKVSTSGGNLSVPSAGLYALHVDLNAGKLLFTATKQVWAIIGSATPGGWSTDTDLTYDTNTKTYTAFVLLTGGNEVKFRFNHAWDTSYGSLTSNGNLDQVDNNNIKVTADGKYLVTLNINAKTYSLVKQ